MSEQPPAPRPNRAVWTSPDTWRDPDCIECGGEGAPCCDPPDHPYPWRARHAPPPPWDDECRVYNVDGAWIREHNTPLHDGTAHGRASRICGCGDPELTP